MESTLTAPAAAARGDDYSWRALPRIAQVYLAVVIVCGAAALAAIFPRTPPPPALFSILLLLSWLTSAWKVNLPISLASGSTLSMSYAANLTALLLVGPQHAAAIAVAGVFTQCTWRVRQPYPLYRTIFSMAAESITMALTGAVYTYLGGSLPPFDVSALARPVVCAIGTYFIVNTGLVAGAIAASTGQRVGRVWREDFLWSGVSFMVAGGAGAAAAVVIDRGDQWKALLLLAPLHLTYRTYQLFVARLADQKRHAAESDRLRREAEDALALARAAEQALAAEKTQLAAARAAAEEANRLKDEFLAMVSHELRTPLNAILGWADILCRGTGLDDVRRERAFHAIHRSAKRQAQLIDDLLDVSRIVSGKLRLEPTVIDFEDVVRDAFQVVQPAAAAKRIQLGMDVDDDIGPTYGDGTRLRQVAWNLLTNAIKFTPEGGRVEVRLSREGDLVQMIVTDTGQGITADFLPAVFEPFRQADGSTTRAASGLGLGLAIVKHLVEAHGGMIRAESAGRGRGATFIVRLPVVAAWAAVDEAHAAAPPLVRAEPVDIPESLQGLTVLVVDDDEESRQVAAAHLRQRGAAVLTAASAADAYDALQRNHVDVALVDIAMPGEDGYSLIRRLRATPASPLASLPAAALTAFAREEDRRQALQAGFQQHLAKPIDPRSLVSAVASLGRIAVS